MTCTVPLLLTSWTGRSARRNTLATMPRSIELITLSTFTEPISGVSPHASPSVFASMGDVLYPRNSRPSSIPSPSESATAGLDPIATFGRGCESICVSITRRDLGRPFSPGAIVRVVAHRAFSLVAGAVSIRVTVQRLQRPAGESRAVLTPGPFGCVGQTIVVIVVVARVAEDVTVGNGDVVGQ